jgi:signal transduction histidine kinase/DNA-binding NarL/FixJ family response regulator
MSPFLRTLEAWTTHQDYLWFLALMAWGAVIGAEFPRKFGRAKTTEASTTRWWLIGVAGCAAAGAATELALLAQNILWPYIGYDLAMGCAQAAGIAALAWPCLDRYFSRWVVWILAVGGATILASIRLQWPVEGGLILALTGSLAAWHAIRRTSRGDLLPNLDASERRNVRAALCLLAWWPAISTHGPLAALAGEPRITADFSHFALLAAGTLTLAGALLALALWHRQLRLVVKAAGLGTRWERQFRFGVAVLAAWLAVGLVLAVWNGRLARRTFEENMLRRAATAAAMLPPELLQASLGPALTVTRWDTSQENGRTLLIGQIPHRRSAAFSQLRMGIGRLKAANPDLAHVYVEIFRDGHLLIPVRGDTAYRRPALGAISQRDVTPEDAARLDARKEFLEGPVWTYWSQAVFARAPLIGQGDRKALGWLVLMVPSTQWTVRFTQARLQAMAVAGLGVVLWCVLLAYRLRREERLSAERRAAAATESDRLKTTFLAKVSHELRTPIQSVLGYGEMLARAPLGDPHRRWLDALRTHGEVMLRLVNDLLDLSALQAGAFRLRLSTVDLPALVADCGTALRLQAESKGLQVVLTIAPDLPAWVESDPVRLKQILLNLLGNAVKFTNSGEVRLSARGATASDGQSAEIEFVVSDTGPGIPADYRALLFRPFSRPHSTTAVEGTGLGLSLVSGLCSAMGGTVVHVDGNTSGTTFRVTLPMRVQTSPVAQTETPRTSGDYAGLRVLVAEDNTLVRELLLEFFRGNGADVTAANDGEKAVALCEQHQPNVVILDVAMPIMDGFAVARAIRQGARSGATRIIGVSAHAQTDDLAQARTAGMDCFLVKPISLAQLDAAVRTQAARTGAPATPRITSWNELQSKLRAQFELETPAMIEDLREAVRGGDWNRVRTRAHYLKNSADVLGARELQIACQALSEPVIAGDSARATRLLISIEAAIGQAGTIPFSDN